MVRSVATTHQVVALTFDDGPNRKVTPEILKILREKGVHATLFLLGVNAKEQPELVKQAIADGHELGNHAFTHTLLSKLSAEAIGEELDQTAAVVRQETAVEPVLFRPPGGVANKAVLAAAKARGYTTVTWSVDPEDWRCPPAENIVERVVSKVKPGSIVLLHDGQYPLSTPEALPTLIDTLRQEGYQFVTVSDLLQYEEVSP